MLKDAITASKDSSNPIKLLVKFQGTRAVSVDYHGGLQYAHLVQVKATPDYLSEIIAAKK